MDKQPIKVLIVDDSSVFRHFLTWILNSDPEIEVIGSVNDGFEAVKLTPILKPDLVTIDVNMPSLNGYETTRKIMETYPVPIIIVSGMFQTSEASMTFESLKAGALAILPKPEGIGHPDHKVSVEHFLRMVKIMAEVKVVRRFSNPTRKKLQIQVPENNSNLSRIVAIGSSAGGPPVLQEILSGLKPDFTIPIFIVQHVDPSFAEGLCSWLRDTTKRNIVIAGNFDCINRSTIYLAPADYHLAVSNGERILVSKDDPEHSCRPSVSYLFRSILQQYGKYALGIILTGMGTDGAVELRDMLLAGCETIVQDPSTALVNGMPGEAIRLHAASQVLTPSEIIKYLNSVKFE